MNCSKGDLKHAESSKPASLLNCELDEKGRSGDVWIVL